MAFYGHAYITFTSLAFQVLRAMRASALALCGPVTTHKSRSLLPPNTSISALLFTGFPPYP
jgi:H+/gluconate symporter-like permease